MQNGTKLALEASLKKFLQRKPLDKITINDLTSDCGISRMAFYYHFKDIYDLVEWVCMEDATTALQGKKNYSDWQEGLMQVFEAVYENKPFVLSAYRSISREKIENYLYNLTYSLIENIVGEQSVGVNISEDNKVFIAHFYKYSFVGVMLDWIKMGMKAEYQEVVQKICTVMRGNIKSSIDNFTKDGE